MARGVAKTPEERIADIETQKVAYQNKIENYKARISDLESQIRELREEQKKAKIGELLERIEASGKTVEEILAAVSDSDKQ